jgi:predicted GH43/DUF377 family glycosyl hydrolase
MSAAKLGLRAQRWESLGVVLRAEDARVPWMRSHAGASFAVPAADGHGFDVYITGRDEHNRSLIGRARLLIGDSARIVDIEPEPVLGLGARGTFDENGVSYPCLFRHDGRLMMLYTGWVPAVLTSFQNDLGLAVQRDDGRFERVSRAPILPRNDADYLGIGSSFALEIGGRWHLWYTSFRDWGSKTDEPKHKYWIKYATGAEPFAWERRDATAVGLEHPGEYVVCRPSVLRDEGVWHMWYCWRGPHYRLGHGVSEDGIRFERRDVDLVVPRAADGFDSYEQCYPHVFRGGDALYMLYCGNGYGRAGLGLARLAL